MKPIRLKFVGLHSYIRPVEVDFERAIKNGIFGILGKTGHGKSTILDAITFALYGRIERLGPSLKEAVNPQVGRIDVDFTFEAGGKRYRITRSFSQKSSSLTAYQHIDGRWRPVAEKRQEFQKFIDRALGGLSFQDFTRVVILPQGKFAAFLELQGSKRAEMLERIFNLELYGRPLQDTVKDRIGELKARMEGIKRSLERLADATPERLKSLQEEQTRTRKLIGILETGLKRLQDTERRLSTVLERWEKLRQATEQLKRHLSEAPEIEKLRGKLKTAQELAHLEDPFERYDSLTGEIDRLEKRLVRRKTELEKVERLVDSAEKELEEFENRYNKRISEIAAMQERIKQARETMDAISKLNGELKTVERELKKVESGLRKREAERGKLADKKIPSLREKLKGIKEKIKRHREKLSAIETGLSDSEIAEIDSAMRSLESARDEFRRVRKQLEITRKSISGKWLSFFGEPMSVGLDALHDELANRRESLRLKLESAENELREYEKRERAALLAAELREGEPCPVCGAVHHPSPALPVNPGLEKTIRRKIEELKKQITELDKFILAITKEVSSAQSMEERLRDIERRGRELRKGIASLLGITPDSADLEKVAIQAVRKARERAKLLKELNELHAEIGGIQTKMDELNSQLRELDMTIAEMESKRARLDGQRSSIRNQLKELKRRVHELIGEESPNELEEALSREKIELDGHLKALRDRLHDINERHERLKSDVQSIESSLKLKKQDFEDVRLKLEQEASSRGVGIKELKSMLMPLEQRRQMEDRIKAWDEQKAKLESEVQRLEDELRESAVSPEYAAQMHGKVQKAIERLEHRIDELKHTLGELRGSIQRLKDDIAAARKLREEMREVEPELDLLEKLESLLHGKALVRFASRFMLTEVIMEANRLLERLTDGRLMLDRPAPDLDFQVIDTMNGGSRSVKTLSGGEKFMVSFSLALALSSHIQRIRAHPIDFFFIDEGFGSLDPERQLVVGRVLEEMMREGRVIGMITHVEAYRELLPAYFIVEKDPEHGSRVRYVGP